MQVGVDGFFCCEVFEPTMGGRISAVWRVSCLMCVWCCIVVKLEREMNSIRLTSYLDHIFSLWSPTT